MAERSHWELEIEGMTCGHCARTIDDVVRVEEMACSTRT